MPRRILLLITDLEIGGTPTVVRELAIRLQEPPEIEVEVACLSRWGPVADQLREAGVVVTAFNARGAGDFFSVVRQLLRLIRQREIDTVFSFLIHANTLAAVASMFCRGIRFLQSIQTTQPQPRWHWVLQAMVQSAAEKVVVPSESAARAARDRAMAPPERIVVISNAIDSGQIRGVGVSPARCERDAHATIAVGFLGRLDPVKRVPDLVRAMTMLDGRFHLEIFGDGAARATIESEIARLNLARRVRLHGAVAKPQAAIERFDILVLPSEAEGFGLVLIEAMAAGVPVVATDVPGIRDVVRDGQTGLLVPPQSPPDLARAIQRIADDRPLRDRIVKNALFDVRERFTWDAVIPKYRQLLGL